MLQMTSSELVHDNFSESTPSEFHTVMNICFAMIIIYEQSLQSACKFCGYFWTCLILGVQLFAKDFYFYVKSISIIFDL